MQHNDQKLAHQSMVWVLDFDRLIDFHWFTRENFDMNAQMGLSNLQLWNIKLSLIPILEYRSSQDWIEAKVRPPLPHNAQRITEEPLIGSGCDYTGTEKSYNISHTLIQWNTHYTHFEHLINSEGFNKTKAIDLEFRHLLQWIFYWKLLNVFMFRCLWLVHNINCKYKTKQSKM